jgi:hypothetical protein
MGGGGGVWFHQSAFRFRNDEGDNNDDTGWMAAKNTNVSLIPSDTTKFRLRFIVTEEEKFSTAAVVFGLYYSLNGGTWTYIDNSDEGFQEDGILWAVASDVAGYTHGSDTTPLLGGTAPEEHTDNNGIVENVSFGDSEVNTWPADNGENLGDRQAEFEWCLILREGFSVPGDSIQIRVYFNDGIFAGGYEEVPFITVGPFVPRTIRQLIIIQ